MKNYICIFFKFSSLVSVIILVQIYKRMKENEAELQIQKLDFGVVGGVLNWLFSEISVFVFGWSQHSVCC